VTTPGGERIRVVVATDGDDADRAATVVARCLRDAGTEVVHAGRLSPEALAATVVQEDADAVGLCCSGPDAPALRARLAAVLADRGVDDVLLFTCGADADLSGPAPVLPPETPAAELAEWLRGRLGR
jgi:methylmalonyl-CoA mutase C-terminal domain/subunit